MHQAGLDVLEPMLTGPTAIAFVRDDVAAVAKVLRDFARANPAFVVKGGLIGSDLLDARRAAALADLPSRDVLLAQLAGLFAAPMQRFAGLLAAIPQKFAYALKALIETRPSEPLAADVEDGSASTSAEATGEDVSADASGGETVAELDGETAAEVEPDAVPAETESPTAEAPEVEQPVAAEPAAVEPPAAEPELVAAEPELAAAELAVEPAAVEPPAAERDVESPTAAAEEIEPAAEAVEDGVDQVDSSAEDPDSDGAGAPGPE